MDPKVSHIGAVHAVTRTLSSTLDLEEALRKTLEVSMEGVRAEAGSILFHEVSSRVLRFSHVVGPKADQLRGTTIRDDEGIAGQVFQTGEPVMDNDVAANPQHSTRVDRKLHLRTLNMVTVPICFPGGETVGVMQLLNKRSGRFTDQDLEILAVVASVAAMSVQNADLAAQAKRAAALYYLGDLAHDIKNKMGGIVMGIGTIQLLKDDLLQAAKDAGLEDIGPLQADLDESIEAVAAGAADVQRYTKFIADAAKGKPIEPIIVEADLAETARRTASVLESVARRQGVRLECQADCETLCSFDRFLIERAIYNLTNNAIPETPAGGTITVRVWCERGSAVLEVRDTGRGMPPHVLEAILDGRAQSSKPGGTGLGTAIVKRAVEAHGGRLEGESAEGEGTAFRLYLPRD